MSGGYSSQKVSKQRHSPESPIMVSYAHRTSFRSEGLMISAQLLSHQSDTTCCGWCWGLGNIILRRGLMYTPKQHHTAPKEEHNVEQKCSVVPIVRCINPNQLMDCTERRGGWETDWKTESGEHFFFFSFFSFSGDLLPIGCFLQCVHWYSSG